MLTDFIIQYKKSCLLLSPLNSWGKSLSIKKLSSSQWGTQVSQILIFTCELEFDHWQQITVSCFPEMTGLFRSFLEKTLTKYLGPNNGSLIVSHSFKSNQRSTKTVASSEPNLNNRASGSARSRNAARTLPKLKKMCTWGLRFNKIIFIAPSRVFFSEAVSGR